MKSTTAGGAVFVRVPRLDEEGPVVLTLGTRRRENIVIGILNQFHGLGAGWDGGEAASPDPSAVRQAIKFVEILRSMGVDCDPVLDVDGAVVLEFDDASLKFKGNGNIVFAFDDGHRGVVPFDGVHVPETIASVMIRNGPGSGVGASDAFCTRNDQAGDRA